jgi:hypothetical protein
MRTILFVVLLVASIAELSAVDVTFSTADPDGTKIYTADGNATVQVDTPDNATGQIDIDFSNTPIVEGASLGGLLAGTYVVRVDAAADGYDKTFVLVVDPLAPTATVATDIAALAPNASSPGTSDLVTFSGTASGTGSPVQGSVAITVGGQSAAGYLGESITGDQVDWTVTDFDFGSEGLGEGDHAVLITVTDSAGNALTSSGLGVITYVASLPPVNSTVPAISDVNGGDLEPGDSVVVTAGTWTGGDGSSPTYRWQQSLDSTDGSDGAWTDIGATGLSFIPGPNQSGRWVRVVETVTNNLASAEATSVGAAVATVGPEIQESGADAGASTSKSVDEDNALSFDLRIGFTVPLDGQVITWNASSAAKGSVVLVDDGSGNSNQTIVGTAGDQDMHVTYTPALDAIGADSFTITAQDSQGNVDSLVVNVTIVPVPQVTGIVRTTPASELIMATSAVFTVTFDEAVNGLDETDFAAANGSVQAFTANGVSTVDVTVAGYSDGTVDLLLAGSPTVTSTANGKALESLNQSGATAGGNVVTPETFTADLTAPEIASVARAASADEVTNGTSVAFTVGFDSPVYNVTTDDFSVSGGGSAAVASVSSASGTTIAVTVTGIDADGTLSLGFAASDITDEAGNALDLTVPGGAESFTIDQTRPTVSLVSAVSEPTNSQYTVTATLSGTGVLDDATPDAGDVLVTSTSGTASLASVVVDSPTQWTITVDPGSDQAENVTVTVIADAISDTAGNTSLVETDVVAIDTRLPVFTTNMAGVAAVENGVYTFVITPSDDSALTDANPTGSLSVNDATVGVVDAGGGDWTVTVTPNADVTDDVVVTIAAGAIVDAAGNASAEDTVTVAVDTALPTVALDSSALSEPVQGQFTVTATVDDGAGVLADETLEVGDVTVTNGTLVSISDGNSDGVWDVVVDPDTLFVGTVTVAIAADVVDDTAGNTSLAASIGVSVDTFVPTVVLSKASLTEPVAGQFTVTATVLDAGGTLLDLSLADVGDVTVTNAVIDSLTDGDSDGTWDIVITPTTDEVGTVTITVIAGAIEDTANNTSAQGTISVDYDTEAPVVALGSGTPNPSSGSFTVPFTLTDDGVLDDDSLVGDATANNATVSVSGSDLVVTPTGGFTGAVTVTVPAGAVTDTAGNGSAEVTAVVNVDQALPVVTLTAPASQPVNGAFTVSYAVSDDVGLSDSSIAGSVSATNATVGSIGGSSFTVTPTGAYTGPVVVTVAAGAISDTAGNDSLVSAVTVQVDQTAPTGAFDIIASPRKSAVNSATIRFAEPVTGVELDDFELTLDSSPTADPASPVLTAVSTSVYTVTGLSDVTATPGVYVLTLPANSVDDAAGNQNALISVTWTVTAADAPIDNDFTGTWFTIEYQGDVSLPVSSITWATATGTPVLYRYRASTESYEPVTSLESGVGYFVQAADATEAGKVQADINASTAAPGASTDVRVTLDQYWNLISLPSSQLPLTWNTSEIYIQVGADVNNVITLQQAANQGLVSSLAWILKADGTGYESVGQGADFDNNTVPAGTAFWFEVYTDQAVKLVVGFTPAAG